MLLREEEETDMESRQRVKRRNPKKETDGHNLSKTDGTNREMMGRRRGGAASADFVQISPWYD